MFMYTSSREKSNRCHSKSESQTFSLILAASKGHQYGVCILSSVNFCGMFWQITQERCTE